MMNNDPARILIIDDEQNICKTLTAIFNQQGYETDTARSGEEALQKAHTQAFDIVLLDIKLPDMDGLHLLDALLNMCPEVIAVMITGHASTETAVQALTMGACGYITKPLDMDAVLALISTELEKQRLRREKQHAEEKLRISEARYHTIFENTGTAMIVIEEDTRISWVNSGFELLSGYPKEEIEGKKHWTEFVASNDLEQMKKYHHLRRKDPDAAPRSYQFQFMNRRGELKDTLLNVDLFRGTNQSFASILDISQLKRAEREIQTSIEQLTQAEEIAHLGSWELDIATGKRVWSDELFRICGLEPDSVEPTTDLLMQITHPDDREAAAHSMQTAIETGGMYNIERRIVRPDGSLRWVQALGKTIFDENNTPFKLSGSFLDITERKQAEQELNKNIKNLQSLQEIGMAVSSTLDLAEVLDIILEKISGIIACDSISIQLLQGDRLKIVACNGFEQPDQIMGLVFPLDPKYANQQVIEKKSPIAFDNINEDYPHFNEIEGVNVPCKIYSMLGVPLITKGQIVGVVNIDRNEVNPFNDEDIQLAMTCANEAAIAIENARLYGEAQRRLENLQAIQKIDLAISGTVDLKIVLTIMLDQIIMQLGVNAADVLLLKPHLNTFDFAAGHGFRTTALQHTSLRMGEGHAGLAAAERRVIHILDLNQSKTGFVRSPAIIHEGFISYFGVPLIAKGQVKGVLEIFQRSELDPDQEWLALLKTVAGQAAIAIDNASMFNEMEMANIELTMAYDNTLEGWARALELHDMETEGHSRRVVDLTMQLSERMGVNKDELVQIRRGALLHDIGKMGVPDNILRKPGALTDEEWQIIKKHPEHAYKMMIPIAFLRPALDIPYSHHEKWDGSGYPQGLKGEQIPLAARIFAVVDVYDALTSDRPYRKAWSEDKTKKYINEQAGVHFDPDVIEQFIRLIESRQD